MALAQLKEIEERQLVEQSALAGAHLLELLRQKLPQYSARGRGLMLGLEFTHPDGLPNTALSLGVMKEMLLQGYILLPEGEHGNVISLTPPLIISKAQASRTVGALQMVINAQDKRTS
jgi:4-aminobutyrate aminotransferase